MIGFSFSTSTPAQLAYTPEIIVSATRFTDSVDRLPVNASVIQADEIVRSTARTLPELLGSRAGIAMRDLYGNDGALSTIDMRGFGAAAGQNTLVLVDGRVLNDIDMSGVQWSSIPLGTIERIEVLRGSGSVQYGDGASAGVINIVTRHPARDGNRVTAGVRFGSWDTRDLSAGLNLFADNVGLYAHARNYESGGYRDNNRSRQSNLTVSGSWTGTAADANLRLGIDRQGIRLPGARLVQPSAGIDLLSSNRRGAATPLDYAQRDGNHLALDLRWQLGAGEFALGMGYRDKSQHSYFDFGGFPDYRSIDLDVLSMQPRFRWQGDGLGGRHSIVAGLDLAKWDYTLRRSNQPSNIGRPINTVGANQDTRAFYLLDTVQVSERVAVNAGLRRERRKLSAGDIYDPGAPGAFGSAAPAGREDARASAYEAGLRIGVSEQTDAILRTGRSFRFANVDEIYETSPTFAPQFQFLRPQSARTHEVGVVVGRKAPWLRASLFRMEVKDEIHLDPFSTGVGNRNLPPLRRDGLEVEIRHSLTRDIDLSTAYALTRARFTEGVLNTVAISGRTVPLVPRHKLDLAANWRMTADTRVRAELHAVGAQYMDNDEGNTFYRRISAYTTADLKLEHRVGPFTATLGVNNLFDRKYFAYAVRSQFVSDRFNAYPLPERSFWIGLEYKGL